MNVMWYFIETNFDGSPLIVLKGYPNQEAAEQALANEPHSGRILSYPTRDKREVYRQWKQGYRQAVY